MCCRLKLLISLLGGLLLAAGCGQRMDPRAEVALPKWSSGLAKPPFEPKTAGYTNWWLQWSKDMFVGGYQNSGAKNPRWDGLVLEALEEHAYRRVMGHARDLDAPDNLEKQLRQAVQAGCNDPLVRYLHLRRSSASANSVSPQVAAQYAELVKQMDATGYGTILKFYANLRAARAWRASSSKQLPEVNQFRRAAMNHLQTVLTGEEIPAHAAYEACWDLYEAVDQNRKQRVDFYQATMPVLLGRWRQQGFPYLFKARFYIDYAWEARGSGWAKDVTPDGWRLFGDRLRLAEEALDTAWKNDATLAEAPLLAMRLQTGLGKGREEMEVWYQRAIKFPQNRYEAVRQKLWFLEPRWYGSEEEMLAFAREVVKNDLFYGDVPLQLYLTHESLAGYYGNSRPNYWTEPQVWPDIQTSFERFFALNGEDESWRHNYVMCAWRCRQWKILDEQITKLSDINYEYFGGQESFEKLKQLAHEQALKPG
jgi:hypothetical protein